MGKWKEDRYCIGVSTLQVNQKPEVAILHNNLYHINSDGINVNNLRCWSVRDIFTSSKNIFLSCWTWNFWKTSNYPQIFTKIQIRFQNDSYYFFKSTWLGLSINFLLFFVFRVLELDFFVWEILTGHFEESLWIFVSESKRNALWYTENRLAVCQTGEGRPYLLPLQLPHKLFSAKI